MKTGFANLNLSFMLIFLSDLVLKTFASPVFIENLISLDCVFF